MWEDPNRIYIPQEQGDAVIPPTLGSLFIASYNLHGRGRRILTRLHTSSGTVFQNQGKSQSHVTTDGQSRSKSKSCYD
jgi:hypothetical protein